jgi:GntR family transcriptional regulator
VATPKQAPQGEAAYRMLARDLRAHIAEAGDAGDTRLPTEAELAVQYGVSRQTVRQAFHELVAAGFVYRVRGKGTFTVPREAHYLNQFGSFEEFIALAPDMIFEVISKLEPEVNVGIAGTLHLSDDLVFGLLIRRLREQVPFAVSKIFFPPSVARVLASTQELTEVGSKSHATIINVLDERLDVPITDAVQSITAVAAPPEVVDLLHCEPGHPVLRIERIWSDRDGRPVEVAISHILSEFYSYRVKLKRQQ